MQAEVEAPVKPGRAARDQRGRVNLDDLTENDLDYGSDERGLARLRRRLTRIVYKFNGESPARRCLARFSCTGVPSAGPPGRPWQASQPGLGSGQAEALRQQASICPALGRESQYALLSSNSSLAGVSARRCMAS